MGDIYEVIWLGETKIDGVLHRYQAVHSDRGWVLNILEGGSGVDVLKDQIAIRSVTRLKNCQVSESPPNSRITALLEWLGLLSHRKSETRSNTVYLVETTDKDA
jgi:hypothetical protein